MSDLHDDFPTDQPTAEAFAITVRAEGAGPPTAIRLRRGLKFLLRSCKLRCIGVQPLNDTADVMRTNGGKIVSTNAIVGMIRRDGTPAIANKRRSADVGTSKRPTREKRVCGSAMPIGRGANVCQTVDATG